jgi:hypothetical protein
VLAAVIGADLPAAGPAEAPNRTLVIDSGEASSEGETGLRSELIANARDTVRFGIDALRAEAGVPYRDATDVDGSHYLHGAASVTWTPDPKWELKASARVDGYFQTGDPDFSVGHLDYGESYVRYRGDGTRVTLGPQVILWGKIDEMAPTDRLSVVDLSRFWLDDLDERRRAVTALRVEQFFGDHKADLVWIPRFRAAEMPEADSLWNIYDQRRGLIMNLPSDPVLSDLVKAGSFDEDEPTDGQFGARFGRSARGLDYALTVQRVRQSTPYYELNPAVRSGLLSGLDAVDAIAGASGPTFDAQYPKSWVYGGDIAFEAIGATWRLEAAYLTDVPATTTDVRFVTNAGVDWGVGTEFFPGDSDTRITLQVLGHHLLHADHVVDWTETYTLTGEIETTFDHSRWRANLRSAIGLNRRDVYVNPSISFVGWDPHELYAGAHYFSGEDGTPGGYHEDHSLVAVGWRAKF